MSKTSKRPTRANRERVRWERKFEGKLSGFDSKEEEIMEKKHLKAYIKGHSHFKNGKITVTNLYGVSSEEDNWEKVKQSITKHSKN